jgi:hypothetical protein
MTGFKAALWRAVRLVLILAVYLSALTRSTGLPGDPIDLIRAYTRAIEFDFASWTIGAVWVKLGQAALGTSDYLTDADRKQAVLDYLGLVGEIWQTEARLNDIYADPNITDPQAASADVRAKLQALYADRSWLEPLAESILQYQIGRVLDEQGLTTWGLPFPPVLYRASTPPYALIVSPRNEIRQIADISISPGLTVDQQAALEEKVDRQRDVSSLVVGIGGIGTYPTMVMQTTDINWLAEVVAHEWIHNYLTLRPLGINYLSSPELRTMNETTASIAGKEIGQAVIARFYPEYLPPPSSPQPEPATPAEPQPLPVFDFRAEMHLTRITVDQLLADGKIEEAEAYMEARRVIFWDNGYRIRKINQAYFAFYGAYADQPGGAAGADPVGAAVRDLRARSASLAAFINRIAEMTSFEQLQQAVNTR